MSSDWVIFRWVAVWEGKEGKIKVINTHLETIPTSELLLPYKKSQIISVDTESQGLSSIWLDDNTFKSYMSHNYPDWKTYNRNINSIYPINKVNNKSIKVIEVILGTKYK